MNDCTCDVSTTCPHYVQMELKPDTIQAGDGVHHGPSNEDWYILGVDTRYRDRDNGGCVCVAGWPATTARLSDCKLIRKGKGINQAEARYRNKTFGSGWDDESGHEKKS